MAEMDILDIGDDRLDTDDDVDDTLDKGGLIPALLNALDVGDATESSTIMVYLYDTML